MSTQFYSRNELMLHVSELFSANVEAGTLMCQALTEIATMPANSPTAVAMQKIALQALVEIGRLGRRLEDQRVIKGQVLNSNMEVNN